MGHPAEEFESFRPLLLGLAYRLLGSMWDAEDVVQDAFLRWMRTDRTQVRETRPFLITVVPRLALDQLRSARVSRETYQGPWLPEPVRTADLGPLDTVELRDTVSYATVHLLQRLSPPERAVFVLREAFELPYDLIADAVGIVPATCRQLHRRARQHLSAGRDRFQPSREEHAQLLTRFLDAAVSGDLTALTELLSADVVAWNDGGGKVRAALHPVTGRDRVVAFVIGLVSRYGVTRARVVSANGEPALLMTIDGRDQFVTVEAGNGLIHTLFAVLNPDKLGHVGAAAGPAG